MSQKFLARVIETSGKVASNAAVWFPLGNSFLAWQQAESSGIALMMGTTAFTTLALVRSSWRQIPSATHYNILSSVNAYLAASVLYKGVESNGLENMINFSTQGSVASWLTAAAFAGWSYCHYINGQLDKIRSEQHLNGQENEYSNAGKENKRNIMNVFASASAVHFDPYQMPVLGLSLLRSVFSKESDNNFDGSRWSYLKKHVSAPRIMAAKYAIGVGILAIVEPFAAAAQACWAIGQIAMEPERNKDLYKDTKAVIIPSKLTIEP